MVTLLCLFLGPYTQPLLHSSYLVNVLFIDRLIIDNDRRQILHLPCQSCAFYVKRYSFEWKQIHYRLTHKGMQIKNMQGQNSRTNSEEHAPSSTEEMAHVTKDNLKLYVYTMLHLLLHTWFIQCSWAYLRFTSHSHSWCSYGQHWRHMAMDDALKW